MPCQRSTARTVFFIIIDEDSEDVTGLSARSKPACLEHRTTSRDLKNRMSTIATRVSLTSGRTVYKQEISIPEHYVPCKWRRYRIAACSHAECRGCLSICRQRTTNRNDGRLRSQVCSDKTSGPPSRWKA